MAMSIDNFSVKSIFKHTPNGGVPRYTRERDRTELVRMLVEADADPNFSFANRKNSRSPLALTLDRLEGPMNRERLELQVRVSIIILVLVHEGLHCVEKGHLNARRDLCRPWNS